MQIGKVNNLAFGNAAKAGAAKTAAAPKNQGAKKDTVTILGKEVNKKAAIGAGVGAAAVATLAALAGRGNKLHKLQGEEGHYFKKFFSNVADGFKSFYKKNADGVNEYKALKNAAKNNKAAEAAKEVADEVTDQTQKASNNEVKKQPGEQSPEVKPEGQPAEQKPEAGGGSASGDKFNVNKELQEYIDKNGIGDDFVVLPEADVDMQKVQEGINKNGLGADDAGVVTLPTANAARNARQTVVNEYFDDFGLPASDNVAPNALLKADVDMQKVQEGINKNGLGADDAGVVTLSDADDILDYQPGSINAKSNAAVVSKEQEEALAVADEAAANYEAIFDAQHEE